MASLTELPFAAALKLASLAVHAEEHLDTFRVNPPAAQFDEAAMRSLLEDPDVRGVLDDPANRALLPLRRSGPIELAPEAQRPYPGKPSREAGHTYRCDTLEFVAEADGPRQHSGVRVCDCACHQPVAQGG